eukprot:TRINITY_DN14963_c0_g1_i3.p1 TRINITY_DN14963_c0_g1~~TRINITY_DN14963_c0_g1_i3.p1  ORF type:complete len:464 (-),score=52.20 TRINITY_DN14963_c0_g1_i3:81-1394(-)
MAVPRRIGSGSGIGNGPPAERIPPGPALGWLKEPEEEEEGHSDNDVADTVPLTGASRQLEGGTGRSSGSTASGIELRNIDLESGESSGSNFAATGSRRNLQRLYSVWPSRSQFFCRGMLMTGAETEAAITQNCSGPTCCAWTCILVPCGFYFLWVLPRLWSAGSRIQPILVIALFLLTTGSLLASCCTDPGILPRREVILATGIAAELEAILGYNPLGVDIEGAPLHGRGTERRVPPELAQKGYRWCRTCRIVRPPRASHCPDCDNCVLRYDHHCPFVNNCVGQRNYKFFFVFVTSVCCLGIVVLPVILPVFVTLLADPDLADQTLKNIKKMDAAASSSVLMTYVAVALGALVAIAALLSMLLWFYHVFLIATKKTTKEFRKDLPNLTEEPTFFSRRGPCLFDPQALVDPRDLVRDDEPEMTPQVGVCSCCFPDGGI